MKALTFLHLVLMIEVVKSALISSKFRPNVIMSSSLHEKVIIVGSGPAGLSAAIMLARRGYTDIKVYDKLEEPPLPSDTDVWKTINPDRTYNIGLNGRGQLALKALGVMDTVDQYATLVLGRKDWAPGSDEPVESIYTNTTRSYQTRCIQREKLSACLLEHIKEKYSSQVKVKFDTDCVSVSWSDDKASECVLDLTSRNSESFGDSSAAWTERSSFVIGADGFQSKIREAMIAASDNAGKGWVRLFKQRESLFLKKFTDTNVRVYRTIPLDFSRDTSPDRNKKWRNDLNYSVRTRTDINLDALPTPEGPYLAVVLYRPWDERLKKQTMKDGASARAFFDKTFPMFSSVISDQDLETFAKKNDSRLPLFSYTGPKLYKGKSTCLLGDAIHTVKPFFGLGVNSAFEDVMHLNAALEKTKDSVPEAIQEYSKERSKEAKTLVTLSRALDGGFLTFVLPLIIDSILHKKLPLLFAPNTIALLQNEKLSFTEVARRKQIDRMLQLMLFSSLLVGVYTAIVSLRAFLVSVLAAVSGNAILSSVRNFIPTRFF